MNARNTQIQAGSKDAWLDAAYTVLTQNGVDAVKIMTLARLTSLTRTGFYWHFKDRADLLEAMVQRWEQHNTGNLVAKTELPAQTITEAMLNLFDCWLDASLFDAPLDLAIRNWARNDSDLNARLDRADKQRIDAIAGIFVRFGHSRVQAQVRAMSVVYTQIGYISMQVDESNQQRLAQVPHYVEVFTGHAPGAAEIAAFRARHHESD